MAEYAPLAPQPQAAATTAVNQAMPASEPLKQDWDKEALQYQFIQRKLSIGAVDDPLENEADTMADKVMRMPEQPFVQSTSAGCGEEVQRRPLAAGIKPFIQAKPATEIESGELTITGEGEQPFIHWPGTSSSGVTIGSGYDIGSRTEEDVRKDLALAGLSQEQIDVIAKGSGKKGAAAKGFVLENKATIGSITDKQRIALFQIEFSRKELVAKSAAIATAPDEGNTNARGREVLEGKPEGTYVLTDTEWESLHPAVIELLTDLRYQGGYYAYDRIAKINAILKADTDTLEQLKGLRTLFMDGYMDEYAGKLKEGKGGKGASETFFGKKVDMEGRYRRNQIRLAYLDKVIAAIESGNDALITKSTEKKEAAQWRRWDRRMMKKMSVRPAPPKIRDGGGC